MPKPQEAGHLPVYAVPFNFRSRTLAPVPLEQLQLHPPVPPELLQLHPQLVSYVDYPAPARGLGGPRALECRLARAFSLNSSPPKDNALLGR